MNYRRSTDRSTDKKIFRNTVDQTHKMNTRKPQSVVAYGSRSFVRIFGRIGRPRPLIL